MKVDHFGHLKVKLALAGWHGWLECRPVHQKVAGLIPGQGTYLDCGFDPWSEHVWEATSQCFSHINVHLFVYLSPPFFLSLKSVNIKVFKSL